MTSTASRPCIPTPRRLSRRCFLAGALSAAGTAATGLFLGGQVAAPIQGVTAPPEAAPAIPPVTDHSSELSYQGPSLRFDIESVRDLEHLLERHGISAATFAPEEGRYFERLRDLLAYHGLVSNSAVVDADNFREAVRAFQVSRPGLPSDGMPVAETLWQLQADWAKARRFEILKVPADVWPGRSGMNAFHLRQDAAQAYTHLASAAHSLGAFITSDGSLRDLKAEVTTGRSPRSPHYAGLAFDLATATGMKDPASDAYIVTREGAGWRVWARASAGQERRLDAAIWNRGEVRISPTTARVIDFTSLAWRYGFGTIDIRPGFPETYASAEWWHFNYEGGLVAFISQFGAEMLSLRRYDEAEIRATPLWEQRLAIFGRGRDPWWLMKESG